MQKRCILIPTMALDTFLRRFSVLPGFIQTGNGESRKAHFVRRSDPVPPSGDQQSGGNQDDAPKEPKAGKYRSLSEITMGEVGQAFKSLERQLIVVQDQEWLATNYFCSIPLQRVLFEERPPVLFGRVGFCYPIEGLRDNLQQLELYFPRRGKSPDLLQIRQNVIHPNEAIQSYRLSIRMYLSKKEQREFLQDHGRFLDLGYAPVFEAGYADLLEITERDRASLPWAYVFGSEWFATVSDAWQVDIKRQIERLLNWNRVVLNFHPRRYLLQYRSLNDEMEFNPGFTEHFLLMPQDTEQALQKVDAKFGEMFLRGLG